MSTVEVGITHEIKINRDKAWIKVGVELDLDPHETIASGIDRASVLVNNKIIDVIDQTVETVEKVGQ